jgi:hypothetical protein
VPNHSHEARPATQRSSRRRLTGNPGLACPAVDGGAGLWLSKLDYACDTSPYVNLDAWVLRQRLLDAPTASALLDSGLNLTSWPNSGASAATWAAAGAIQPKTPVGCIIADGSLPVVSAPHSALAGPAQWAPAGSAGASFCVVAKLPATAAAGSDQVLFDFSPAFAMARDNVKVDLAFFVGATRCVASAAFDGRWHSYVAVTTGASSVVYVDGVQKVAIKHAAVNATSSQAALHLFGAPSKVPAAMLAGSVCQVMAWRRALAAAKLAALHAQLKIKWKL